MIPVSPNNKGAVNAGRAPRSKFKTICAAWLRSALCEQTNSNGTVSTQAKFYRNAWVLAVVITLVSYRANMTLRFRSGADSGAIDVVLEFSFVVLFVGGTAMGWLADGIGASDEGYFFFLLPFGACLANSVVALMIASAISRMRRSGFTHQWAAPNGGNAARQQNEPTDNPPSVH